MSTKDNGGPAFPSDFIVGNSVGASKPFSGMTLRDWVAGQALPAVISACDQSRPDPGETWNEMVARQAYEIADAMLAERSK